MRPVLSGFSLLLLVVHFACASTAAKVNITTEDSIPLLVYSPPGAWSDSLIEDPSQPQTYSSNSWHSTSSPNATASLTFNGTGVWFFGTMRPGYGSYEIIVDGSLIATNTANAVEDQFQVLLGGIGGLSASEHTAELVNLGDGIIDLDVVVFETWIGSALEEGSVFNEDISGTNSELQASPPGSWQTDTSSATQSTFQGGATMQYNFQGDAIAVYGPTSSSGGAYSILIDGKGAQYQASSGLQQDFAHEHSLMHFANDLGPGLHTLIITANSDQLGVSDTGKVIGISAISVYRLLTTASTSFSATVAPLTAIALATETLLTAPSSTTSAVEGTRAGSSALNTTAILAAIAAGAGLFAILSIAILFFCLRRRRQRHQQQISEPPPSPKSFIQRPMSNATGAWGRPAIPRSTLQTALGNPFADPVPTFTNPFADRAVPNTIPRPMTAFESPGAGSPPTYAVGAAQAPSRFRRSQLDQHAPSPRLSSSSQPSYGSDSGLLVPWTQVKQLEDHARDAEEGRP